MTNLNKILDLCIIIPAYNSKETIEKTLDSIKIQKLSITYEVIIVNDCSDYNYDSFINKYKKYYKIREIKTKKNSGPGVARQMGIDNSNSKYIVFIDSDDYFYDEYSISKMYNTIEQEKMDLVICNFILQRDKIEIVKKKNSVWLHGKIYRRQFLQDNNIKFNNTRANEDNGFNRLILFMNAKFKCLNETVYVYVENLSSITRRNNRMYSFFGIEGFCNNMYWAINEAIKRGKHKEDFGLFTLDMLTTLYMYYLSLSQEYDLEKIFEWGNKIKKIYNYSENNITKEQREYYLLQKKIQMLDSIIINNPRITFEEFLNKFKN